MAKHNSMTGSDSITMAFDKAHAITSSCTLECA